MPRLRVSDTEYYNVRRRRRDNGTYFNLSPYSCMNPISFYFDQVRRQISIYLRSSVLYEGIADLSRIKEEIENMDKLNPVELVTLLTILSKEPDTRDYVTGRRSPIDRVTYALAYESADQVRKEIEEAMESMDPEKLLYILNNILESLPENLREPMMEKFIVMFTTATVLQ